MPKKSKDSNITSRVWEVVTDLVHPVTKEKIIDVDTVKDVIENHKSIKDSAFIVHDKDIYVTGDQIPKDKKVGELKPAHVHIVLRFDRAQEVAAVSKWFGVPDNFIEKKKGVNAFYDSLVYLTHESEKERSSGKHLYSDEEVHCYFESGKSFREYLNDNKPTTTIRETKDIIENLELGVMFNGLSLCQIKKDYPREFNKDMDKLKKNRSEYLSTLPLPKYRISLYIEGSGGAGKGLLSEAIARAIIDPDNKLTDDEIFSYVGADSVGFEAYDGQPVLIWDDCRHYELFKKLGTRGNIFNVFDTKPKRIYQKKKFSHTNLVNTINIVNSVENWKDFLGGLAGTYRDRDTGDTVEAEDNEKSQSYRRFPIVIKVSPYYYDLYFNKAFFEKSSDPLEMEAPKRIAAPLKKLKRYCGNNDNLYLQYSSKAVQPIVELLNQAKELYLCKTEYSPDKIEKMFDFVGDTVK